jgi:hypothetical protein
MYAIFNTIHKIGGYLNYLPVAPILVILFSFILGRENKKRRFGGIPEASNTQPLIPTLTTRDPNQNNNFLLFFLRTGNVGSQVQFPKSGNFSEMYTGVVTFSCRCLWSDVSPSSHPPRSKLPREFSAQIIKVLNLLLWLIKDVRRDICLHPNQPKIST